MKLPIMLFAAGLGTRMAHLTKDRPKPLVEIGETTLIDHALSFATQDRFSQRIVNLHYKAEMLRAHLKNQNIQFSDETSQLMETGGGLKKVIPLLEGDEIATTNTDAVWKGQNPFDAILSAWQPENMTCLLLLVPKSRAHGHKGSGDFSMNEKGQLTRGPDLIYTGVQITKTEGFSDMPDGPFSMNLYWDVVAQQGGLYGAIYNGEWCDVGQPSSIPIAEAMLAHDV